MIILRVILQALVVIIGSLFTFIELFADKNLLAAIVVATFFTFVFLLTLLLREHSKTRLIAGHRFNQKLNVLFLAFVGSGICWTAWRIAIGEKLSGHGSRIINTLIGMVGAWPVAIIFFLLGVITYWLSYRLLRYTVVNQVDNFE